MKLLIVTQKVNADDPILGFFHGWIREFSNNFEKITVICLEKGKYNLPENVKVLSLGKEEGQSRIKYILRFYKYIWQERKNYDSVFVHMNPVYVILGSIVWKTLRKRILLWYTHKNVDTKLRIAEKIVDKIFSASSESFRLPSRKIHIIGHGIDTDFYLPNKKLANPVILTVGRISAVKRQLEIIKSYEYSGINIPLVIVGGPVTYSDKLYLSEIENYIKNKSLNVILKGSLPPSKIVNEYHNARIFLHLSKTGSLDKVVLEALACEVTVISSDNALKNVLGEEYITSGSIEDLSNKIKFALENEGISKRDYVVKNHNLKLLMLKIKELLIDHE